MSDAETTDWNRCVVCGQGWQDTNSRYCDYCAGREPKSKASNGRWWKAKWKLLDGGPTYSNIWARDIDEARRICAQLGFEEPKRTSQAPAEFRVSRLARSASNGLASADVLHTLCYLSTLAGRAGVATAEELVGDGSPLHELSHYLGLGGKVRYGRMREFVLKRIDWLESIIPGMPPAEVDLPIYSRMPGAGRTAEVGQ